MDQQNQEQSDYFAGSPNERKLELGRGPTPEPDFKFPSILFRKLRVLDKTLRTYVVLDGAATFLIATVAVLALDLGLDRFFEFSRIFRAVLLFGLIAAVVYLAWLRIVRRAYAKIRDDQLAMVFERFVPSLNETLITAVELSKEMPPDVDQAFLRQTVQHAAASLKNVNVRRFFRYGRLGRRIALALIVLGLAVGSCFAFSETASIWCSRNILLSNRDWPRRSQLVVEGFEKGSVRIGRGDSLTLNVRANTSMPLVPESVRLLVGSRESGIRTILLDQFRVETVDGIDWRVFSYPFAEMLEALPFAVRGGDVTVDDLRIEVVPQPILSEITVRQTFPKYLDRSDRTISPTGRTVVPEGTAVTITATSNKPLRLASVSVDRGEPMNVKPASAPFENLTFSLPPLRSDTVVEFHLSDLDGLQNRVPLRLEFGILKDTPPNITARLEGIGAAVTPSAQLPTLGEVADDNALADVRYRFFLERKEPDKKEEEKTKSESEPPQNSEQSEQASTPPTPQKSQEGTVEIPGLGPSQTLFSLSREFSVSDRQVVSGDKLAVLVEATDRFELDDSTSVGQTGVGPRWSLEIVSPERLKSLLEIRETSLRQRFEVLIGEVERTKSLLEDFSPEVPEELRKEVDALAPPQRENRSETDFEKEMSEFETKKRVRLETISKEQAATGKYNISRALRDTQKEVYDLRTLIESFRSIRLEMINNRIFSEETERRLDGGILVPMQGLVDADFFETDRLIGILDGTLDVRDKPLRPLVLEQRKAVLTQFDLVLKKMSAIRDNMVSMESFNEAVELLRSILKQQQQLRNETKEEKNKRLKNLLDP